MGLILHVGLPKTGTSSIQRHLPPILEAHGWETNTSRQIGWDAARVTPVGTELVLWDGDGSFDRAVAYPARRFVSHENIAMASAGRVAELAGLLDPDETTVLITWTTCTLTCRRWWKEIRKHGLETPLADWLDEIGWTDDDPGPDGSALRRDVVAARWRAAGMTVRLLDTHHDAIKTVAKALGVPAPSGFVERVNTSMGEWPLLTRDARAFCMVADRWIADAVDHGLVASLHRLRSPDKWE